MTSKWGKVVNRNYTSTGKFVRALTGDKVKQIGEIVYYHGWGGVDVRFEDDTILTYANDDIQPERIRQ